MKIDGLPDGVTASIPKIAANANEAAIKLLYLAIQNAGIHWRRPIEWTAAMGQFAVLFGDRFTLSAR